MIMKRMMPTKPAAEKFMVTVKTTKQNVDVESIATTTKQKDLQMVNEFYKGF